MPPTSFERANLISGQSKLYPTRKFTEYMSSLNLIDIPLPISHKENH
jgi:hypothetical protein